MSFPRYERYKESGVEWLGEVPEHWEVKKMKYASDTSTGFAFSSDDYTDEGIPLIRIGDILQDGNIDIENSKKLPIEYLRIYREAIIKKNDILMAMTGATIGKAGQYQFEEPGLLNQRVCRFVPLLIVGKYLWFILKSEQYLEHIILTGFGGAQPNISDAQLLDFVTALPPLPEQQSIAAFLDRETSRIDSLIGKKKNLVELLAEQRTALISRAVTKGLDAGVKLKPSGVEWLGEVPEHWVVKKIVFLLDRLQDGTHFSPESDFSGEYLYITAKNIKEWGFDLSEITYVSKEAHDEIYKRCPVKKGDILYIKDGATAGIATVNSMEEEFSMLSSVAMLRPRYLLLDSRFLAYHLNMKAFKNFVLNSLVGGAMTRFTIEIISKFRIVTPHLSEQQAIAAFLDRETARIDALVSKVEMAIDTLKEYRTALISAAVTGKIDVREKE